MAATLTQVQNLLWGYPIGGGANTSSNVAGFTPYDVQAPVTNPMTAAQRVLFNATLTAGTVVTKSDATALLLSSAVAASASPTQAWQYLIAPASPPA